MTMLFTVNQTPATPAVAMFSLLTLLESAGWTRIGDSDGSTYRSTAPWQLTTGASGAGGLDNAYAWFVVKMPGCNRSWCFQRNSATGASTSRYWRVKYSKGAGFVGGSPSATRVPSATDEVVLLGAGTDASPTMPTLLFVTGDGTFRFNCCADSAAPHGFLAWTWTTTIGLSGLMLGLDPQIGCPAEDTDPYVVYCHGVADSAWTKQALQFLGASVAFWLGTTWYPKLNTYPGPSLMCFIASYSVYVAEMWGGCYTNVLNTKDDLFPLVAYVYLSATPSVFYKGISTLLRACGPPGRSRGDLFTITAAKDGVYTGYSTSSILYQGIVLPWDGSSTPLI